MPAGAYGWGWGFCNASIEDGEMTVRVKNEHKPGVSRCPLDADIVEKLRQL
jgi:hypothetical protein